MKNMSLFDHVGSQHSGLVYVVYVKNSDLFLTVFGEIEYGTCTWSNVLEMNSSTRLFYQKCM